MARILIKNLFNKEIYTEKLTRTLLSHFQEHQLDWLHSCGAKGKCTTCKVVVVEGVSKLSALSEAERRYRSGGSLLENERLACQTRITGDVCITVPEENKLAHVKYSD